MVERLSFEEENIVKDIQNLFRLDKETKAIKDTILRDKSWSNNYIEYETNGDRNKTLSFEEHPNKIRPFLKDINNLKKWCLENSINNNK